MSFTSVLQILKVNDLRSGSKDGRAWQMQDAECILLGDSGEVQQVGVLQLPRHLVGEAAPAPGTYVGGFALQAGMRDRRISAVLVSLQPYTTGRAASSKPAAS
ncbi:hypothetical protein [Paracidovorax wautersii]|uniref:hypothetical protein n=1 Tax=Paracidovorax wautersii TaxID=1177982 RepID=UPI0031E22EEB